MRRHAQEEETAELVADAPGMGEDPNVDPDEFKRADYGKGVKPHGWNIAERRAEKVIQNEMRFLLELHYDDVHMQKYNKRQASADAIGRHKHRRGSEYNLFNKLIGNRFHRRHGSSELPDEVKEILRTPDDECDSRCFACA